MAQLTQISTAVVAPSFHLSDDIKTILTIQRGPLNRSVRFDGIREYMKALWSSNPTLAELQDLVEDTWCADYIENFANHIPGADVNHLRGLLAILVVMES
jgi:hypothetical protein